MCATLPSLTGPSFGLLARPRLLFGRLCRQLLSSCRLLSRCCCLCCSCCTACRSALSDLPLRASREQCARPPCGVPYKACSRPCNFSLFRMRLPCCDAAQPLQRLGCATLLHGFRGRGLWELDGAEVGGPGAGVQQIQGPVVGQGGPACPAVTHFFCLFNGLLVHLVTGFAGAFIEAPVFFECLLEQLTLACLVPTPGAISKEMEQQGVWRRLLLLAELLFDVLGCQLGAQDLSRPCGVAHDPDPHNVPILQAQGLLLAAVRVVLWAGLRGGGRHPHSLALATPGVHWVSTSGVSSSTWMFQLTTRSSSFQR
mmetsp:Transcript_15495/g.41977  ORF Transcript_15495/g.41977 Transcript_15495/m.41977 type:complete len:312 (-) Transcript_15495:11-946(-)